MKKLGKPPKPKKISKQKKKEIEIDFLKEEVSDIKKVFKFYVIGSTILILTLILSQSYFVNDIYKTMNVMIGIDQDLSDSIGAYGDIIEDMNSAMMEMTYALYGLALAQDGKAEICITDINEEVDVVFNITEDNPRVDWREKLPPIGDVGV